MLRKILLTAFVLTFSSPVFAQGWRNGGARGAYATSAYGASWGTDRPAWAAPMMQRYLSDHYGVNTWSYPGGQGFGYSAGGASYGGLYNGASTVPYLFQGPVIVVNPYVK